ncbi:MAG: Uma2 family endonuclease [Cyanobacteria bacterium P01_H01_bin.15]
MSTEKQPRKSWVVWEKGGKYPNLIIEILSDSPPKIDRNLKKELYQNTFRTPDYFWFDPGTQEFAGFHLVDGKYEPILANEQGHLWSQKLNLFLGVHEGKLRYFQTNGELVPTPEESALTEREKAQQEKQRADDALAEIERLKALLAQQNRDSE